MMSGRPEMRSLALTPTWSVATVLTIFVFLSLLVERAIHRLSSWLKKTHRNPLFEALEKMKEELMLLGFISLLLTATSRTVSSICIDSNFYNSKFSPCKRSEVEETADFENVSFRDQRQRMAISLLRLHRRILSGNQMCEEGHEPFVSYEGLEQLHRFIFVMAITHVSYSCLTMLLAIVKVHSWREWEEEAHKDPYDSCAEITRALTVRRQSSFAKVHASKSGDRNSFVIWVNHNLTSRYDFHGYMIRSMEEEFKMIVGVSVPLWGFVVAFMLFNVNGSNLYFWIAIMPITLVLLVGAKLQHVIATLALESVGIAGSFSSSSLKPRDELFWFKRPELLLLLIHFILFQNAFELASFFWFWWQFGYDSCFLKNHWLVYARLILGFSGQFLCSYSTLPLYALVTQMGTNYKAALIPHRIRETMHGWGKAARKRRKHRQGIDESTIHTETSMVFSIEEDEQDPFEDSSENPYLKIELQPATNCGATSVVSDNLTVYSLDSSHESSGVPLLKSSCSVPSSPSASGLEHKIFRSVSMPP
ncbi:hypothetical protein HPP92_014321 [Vanilla planifolia]|uniref:MLO-like protein n=1 Tax=Vanilla planifolia TaxID=51239 RepID=A0A835QJS7_VANPL|nr:hypothetical protein HPP92_014321 [Vanilla planifolia]